MAYFIMDSKRAAYDESGSKNVVKVQVDSSSDLPNPVPDNWAPGSVCWDVSTGDIYGLNSLGLWNKQGSGGGSATLIEKTITENDTYNASDDGADGYSSVTVNVPSAPETFDVELTLTVADESTADVSSSEAFNDVMTAVDNGAKLNLVVTLNDGNATETLSNVMYSKAVYGSTSYLIVFGRSAAAAGWFHITWSGDATTANVRQAGMISIEIEGE